MKRFRPYVYVTIGGLAIMVSFCFVFCFLNTKTYSLRHAMKMARGNKNEILKALEAYPQDTEKYEAMVYLVKYMPWHSSLSQMENGEQILHNDVEVVSANYLIQNVDEAYETWRDSPWKTEVDFKHFCKYILPFHIDGEPVVKWRKHLKQKYAHLVKGIRNEKEAFRIVHGYLKENFKVKDTKSENELDVLTLDSLQGGNCRERAIYMTYVMRALGIASATDFTPFWTNQGANGHFWVSMIGNDNQVFTLGKDETHNIDGAYEPYKYTLDRQHYLYHVDSLKRIAKVYRYTYDKIHNVSNESLSNLPDFLHCAYAFDVTSQYHNLTDESVLPLKTTGKESLYVCTYQQQTGWKPVGKAERIDFSHVDIGPMIHDNVVIVATFKDGTTLPRSNPYLVRRGYKTIELIPDVSNGSDVRLYRKYGLNSRWVNRWGDMVGTKIETSDKRNFSTNVYCLYTITNLPIEKVSIPLDKNKLKRFLRLLPADGRYPVLAEIDLVRQGEDLLKKNEYKLYAVGNGLTGDTIPLKWLRDNDPTTTFFKQFPFWIGIDIRQCLRELIGMQILLWNDCNRVTKGHDYELFYFDHEWHSLGQQKADHDWLDYKNVPQNALLLLRDYTKGKEERVFVYEKGKQIWW